MSSTSSVARGLATLAETFQNKGRCGAPNDACMVWMWQQGPYGGLDPASNFAVADVARGRGIDESRQWTNLLKAAATMEALGNAGVDNPHAALTKTSLATDAAIAVRYGSSMPIITGNKLNFHKNVEPGLALSSVPSDDFVASQSPLTQLATFPGGTSLVTAPDISGRPVFTVPGRAPTYTRGTASLAAGGVALATSRTPQGAVRFDGLTRCGATPSAAEVDEAAFYLPSSIGGALNDSNAETIPGLTLFAVPTFDGENTTLIGTGAGMIDAMAKGDFRREVAMAGGAEDTSGLLQSFFPYDPAAWRTTQSQPPAGPGYGSTAPGFGGASTTSAPILAAGLAPYSDFAGLHYGGASRVGGHSAFRRA